ncbi:MAG: VWA domain-containing protein [Sedimenticolaceae bacterium]
MVEHFHFIQPLWLLALLPLAVMLWLITRRHHANSPWSKLVDAQLLPLLLDDQKTQRSRTPVWLLSLGWLLAVLALADPAWEQQPQPLRQTGTSRIIVLDLSRSMLAPDLKPSRLVRARFKVEDILAHDPEGQTGLVVFAGDAFTVSPLTRDADTIRAQLRALDPSIMPSQGSRADLGLLKAYELLQQAEVKSGQVILIADGVEGDRAANAAGRLGAAGYDVSVLGVGTPAGAPIPDGRGGTLRDNTGKPLLAALDSSALAAIAKAGGGHYSALRGDQSDLDTLLRTAIADGESVQSDDLQSQKWKGQGPLLAALLLPLAALAFRRGWVLSVVLCAGTLAPTQPAMAFGWDELWQRKDQQAAQALQQGEYELTVRLAEDPARRASALYRQGDYEKAVDDFNRASGADASYNRGNALAMISRYEEAISAYDQALELQPGMEDALANKAAVEALLSQQQEDQTPSDQQSDQDQSSEEEQASSAQNDPGKQEQDTPADSGESGEQDTPSQPDQQQASQGQTGEEQNAGQKNQDAQADSGGSGDQENSSQPDEQQASQAQTGEQEQSAQQEQDAQADAGGSGNREDHPQSDDSETPEKQMGAKDSAEQNQRGSENQFADANRELDKGRDDGQAERESGAPEQGSESGQPGADDGVAKQSPSTDQQQQSPGPSGEAEALNTEEQMAAQQWLRRIPDDPGGLLRRKFLYQYRQRPGGPGGGSSQDW